MDKWLSRNGKDLSGKRAAVTGASGGLGRYISLYLAELGAEVVLACRSVPRGEAAAAWILERCPDAKISVAELDVSKRADIDRFAAELRAGGGLDYLINNAGVLELGEGAKATSAGIPMHCAVNYYGAALLTETLLPCLAERGGKALLTGSMSYKYCRIDPQDVCAEGKGGRMSKYARSKRLLALYYLQLSDKLARETSAASVALWHPGVSGTDLFLKGKGFKAFNRAAKFLTGIIFMKPNKAARGAIHALLTDAGRDFWTGAKLLDIWGNPKTSRLNLSFTPAERALNLLALDEGGEEGGEMR